MPSFIYMIPPPLGRGNNSPNPYGEGGVMLVDSRGLRLDINRK